MEFLVQKWSFKVPSGEEVSSSQVSLDQESSTMASARSVRGQTVEKSAGGRQMGPAFEQPATGAAARTKLATIGKPNSEESSSSSAEAYSLASSSGTFRTSSRPDPVAQVRAYLRSSSPSTLSSRTPYRSQVYLSSQPVSVPSYDPPAPALENTSTSSASTVGFKSSLPGADFTANAATPNYSPATSLLPTNLPGAALATNPPLSASDYTSAAAGPNTYPSAFETVRSSDGLPQLQPAVPSSYTVPSSVSQPLISQLPSSVSQSSASQSSASQPSTSSAIEAAQSSEDFSIGTAILHDLERKSAAESAPEVAAAETSLPQPVSALPSPAAGTSVAMYEVETSAQASQASYRELARSESAISEPTISRLIQTMPEREISPLVASFRAGSDLSQPARSKLSEFPASNGQSSESQSSVPAIAPTLNRETELRSSDLSSPLLEGLLGGLSADTNEAIESSSQSTIYVPIATAIPVDSSGVLIPQAISALNTEDSTSDFINELTQRSVFSSVVSPAALPNSRSPQIPLADSSAPEVAPEEVVEATATLERATPTIAQRIPFASGFLSSSSTDATLRDGSNGSFNAFDKLSSAELAIRRDKARRAAVTLAAQQASQRRQRVNWL